MAGQVKFLRFSDGTTVTAPSALTIDIGGLAVYIDDAAFVAAKGSAAAEGDIYYNSTIQAVKFYKGSWAVLIDSNSPTITSPDIDGGTIDNAVIGGATPAAGTFTDLTATGDLTVQGTITSLETATLDVEDANVTVNKGGTQATADAQDAGVTVEMSDATNAQVGYDSTMTSKFKAGEIGAESEVATVGHAQALTNKTITDASNNISATQLTSGTIPDARVPASAVTQHEGSINHDALTNFVSTEHIDWTLDAGVDVADANISQTSVTQHQAAVDHDALTNFVANEHVDHSSVSVTAGVGLTGGGDITSTKTIDIDIDGLTVEGSPDAVSDYLVMYDTSALAHRKVLVGNVGGSGGGGEGTFNYVTNPSASTDATTGVVGTGGPVATRGTTAATFASNYFSITGFDGAGDEFEWSTDTLQAYHDNILFQWSISAKLTLVGSGTYTVGLWDGSAYVGDTATLINGSVVNASGSFVFDSSVTYTIRIVSDASANASDSILVKDVTITNEGAVVGEASTPWTDYTPGTQGFGTISADNIQYKQQGDSVAIMGYLTLGTVTAVEAQIDLPTGMTIGGKGTGSVVVGYLDVDSTQGAARSRRFQLVATKGDTFLNIALDISDADENSMSPRTANSIFNSSTRITFSSVFIPIAELSGTQNIGENNVEYTSNTGTWDANDSTSFATGSGGQAIPTSTDLTTQRYKRVRFSSATDVTELEVQLQVAGKWVNAAAGVFHETGWITNAFMHGASGAATASAGIGIRPVSGSDTDFDVYFGRYGNVYSSSFTTGWSAVISTNTVKWRVRKCSPGSPVGYGLATSEKAGLVSTSTQTLAGDKTFQDEIIASKHVRAPVDSGSDFDETAPAYSFTGDTDTGIFNRTANTLSFATGGTQRMEIDSSGSVHVNGTGGPRNFNVFGAYHGQTGAGTGNTAAVWADGNGDVCGSIITNATTNTCAYNTSSDARLKTNHQDFNGCDILDQLNPTKYERISSPGSEEYGLVAQEVHPILPQAANEGGDDARIEPWSIDYGQFTPILIKAMKEMRLKIEELEARLASVE